LKTINKTSLSFEFVNKIEFELSYSSKNKSNILKWHNEKNRFKNMEKQDTRVYLT